MKRRIWLLWLAVLLTGCGARVDSMGIALELRGKLNRAEECGFIANIVADYGDRTYTFTLDCMSGTDGDLVFRVISPESISGITGKLSRGGGELVFDDVALAFTVLTDGQLSPVSAPWIFLKALRSGYITSAGVVQDRVRIVIDDSYQEESLSLHLWLDEENMPALSEIYFQDRRIVTITISDYRML